MPSPPLSGSRLAEAGVTSRRGDRNLKICPRVSQAGKGDRCAHKTKKLGELALSRAGFAHGHSREVEERLGQDATVLLTVQTARRGSEMSEVQYSADIVQLARKSQKWRDQWLENSDGRIKAARCGAVFGAKSLVKSAV